VKIAVHRKSRAKLVYFYAAAHAYVMYETEQNFIYVQVRKKIKGEKNVWNRPAGIDYSSIYICSRNSAFYYQCEFGKKQGQKCRINDSAYFLFFMDCYFNISFHAKG
jgi:hypothetical protein